jgi:hypothetical protein
VPGDDDKIVARREVRVTSEVGVFGNFFERATRHLRSRRRIINAESPGSSVDAVAWFDGRAPRSARHCGAHEEVTREDRMLSSQPAVAMPLGGVHLVGRAPLARGARVCRATSASSASTNTASASRTQRTPKTLGWGERRGAIPPDDPLLTDPATFGYCVYSHADWSHAYKSVSLTRGDDEAEHDLERCEVWGVIPAALRGGVLYRNGPALFERGGVEYKHMLDGDGMVCRFEFRGRRGRIRRDESATRRLRVALRAHGGFRRGVFGERHDQARAVRDGPRGWFR